MPRKACCCGGGNYVAIPCRAWGHAVFVGYQGLTGIQGASGIAGYNQYFGPTATALFKRSNSIFGLSGPFAGQHPFYKFYSGGFVVGVAGFGSATPAPLKIAGFTGCTDTGPGGQNWGGYNGTTCYEAIFVTDNERPVFYKLWGAGGGAVSTALYGGNGAYTQVSGVYNENNIACVGMGGFGKNMVENFTGWTGILPTYNGGGGQGFPAWGGGAAFVSSSFNPMNNVAIVGAGGGAGESILGAGHGGATAGRDATAPQGGRGAVESSPGTGGLGAQSGQLFSGGRGSTGSTAAVFDGGGGGGGGLAGGGGGGITGYAGGGGSSEVTEWSRSGTDQGPPNICDPYFWTAATDLASSVGGKIFGGFGGHVSGRVPASDAPENRAEFGMSGKVSVVYSSMRCVCDDSLDTIPEQTYICLNQNQYDSIIQQARGSSACYGSQISFGGATGLSAFGGLTSGFLQWTFGEGGDVPKIISFYYDSELYYLIGQCSSLCDPAYQVPEDATLTLADCREYGACCQARLALPYCKIPTSGPGNECFDVAYQCPSDCQPVVDKPSPFYICETSEENVDIPDGVFWTKKNGYYYIVAPTQGWIPFGEQLYPTEIISEIILQEPCCSLEQEGCSGGIDTNTPSSCCKIVNEPFPYPHPGRASITATISFNGNPDIPGDGDCGVYPTCCQNPTPYNSVLTTSDIRCNEIKYFSPKSSFYGASCPVDGSGDCFDEQQQQLSYSIYYPSNDEENPYIPVFRIESSCNCSIVCSLPEIYFNDIFSQQNCESVQNFGTPIVIVQSGGIDDIVSALQSVSNNRYTVTKLSSQKFWFGFRSQNTSCVVPGDDILVEEEYVYTPDGNGVRCVRTYYARSPYAGVRIGTCGSLINNCSCQYRVMPSFIQSLGIPDPNANPGCAVQPWHKTLVEWSENPSTIPLLTSGAGCFGGLGISVYLCSGFYASCSPGFWSGSSCSFTAKGDV